MSGQRVRETEGERVITYILISVNNVWSFPDTQKEGKREREKSQYDDRVRERERY